MGHAVIFKTSMCLWKMRAGLLPYLMWVLKHNDDTKRTMTELFTHLLSSY
jgi:hypothetical protein